MRRFTDSAIELLLILLLLGLPFSLGAVEAWGYGAMELAVALLALLFVLRALASGGIHYFSTPLNFALVCMFALVLLQLIPLPPHIMALISPPTAEAHRSLKLIEPSVRWFPVALDPTILHEEFLKLIAYAATFFIALNWFHDQRRAKRFFVYFALVGAAITVFALIQLAFWNGKIFWRIPTQSAFPFGPYVNHNHFAGFIELTLGAALGLLLAEIQPVISGERRLRDFSGAGAMLLAGLCCLMILGVFLSRSRGGIVSIVGAGLITPFLIKRSESRRAMVSAFAFIVLLVGAALALGSGALLGNYQFAPNDPSALYRLVTWRDTLKLARDYLFIGCGLGNFAEAFPAYKSSFAGFFIVHPENDYLQTLAETGLIGFGLAIAFMVIYYRHVQRWLGKRHNERVRSLVAGGLFGLVAFSLHGLYDFNFHIPANAFAFVLLAALTFAQVSLHVRADGETAILTKVRSFSRRRSPVLFIAAAAALLFCSPLYAFVSVEAALNNVTFLSWFQTHRVQPPEQALHVNDPPIVGYEAEMLHWRARQLFDYGQMPVFVRLQQYAFFERAAELARQAVAMRPARGRYWALYAKSLAELGEQEQALRAFDLALKYDPSNDEIHYDLARYAVFLRDADTAARELAAARRLNPRMDISGPLELLWQVTSDERVLRQVIVSGEEERTFAAWYAAKTRANSTPPNR